MSTHPDLIAFEEASSTAAQDVKRSKSAPGYLQAATRFDQLCSQAESPARDQALEARANRLWQAAEAAQKTQWPEDVVTALREKAREDLVAAGTLTEVGSDLLISAHVQLGDHEAAEQVRRIRRERIAEDLPYLTAEQKQAVVDAKAGRTNLGLF